MQHLFSPYGEIQQQMIALFLPEAVLHYMRLINTELKSSIDWKLHQHHTERLNRLE